MLPVGYAEIVKHTQIMADNSCGPWRMKTFSALEQATPQLNELPRRSSYINMSLSP
ncbi:unnamed protein product [Ectocarpus fasciculatus]